MLRIGLRCCNEVTIPKNARLILFSHPLAYWIYCEIYVCILATYIIREVACQGRVDPFMFMCRWSL